MILVALLYAILASTFILAKNALNYSQPFFLIAFRMTVAGIALLSYASYKGMLQIRRTDCWLFFKAALFHIYLSFMLEFWALQHLSALETTIIYSATPFIAALLSYWLLKEKLNSQKIVGISLGLMGIAIVIVASHPGAGASWSFKSISLPEVVLLLAVISGAYAWFVVKELMTRSYSLITINGVAMLIGGIMSFFTLFVANSYNPEPFVYDWTSFLFWVGLLILISNVVVYNFYGWLLKRYTITFLTFAGFLCPVFATLYDWLLFDGSLTWQTLASLGLITLGLYLFYKAELPKETA